MANQEYFEYFSNFRGFRVAKCYIVEVNEGTGTPENPINRVTYYLNEQGEIIGHTPDEKDRKFRGE